MKKHISLAILLTMILNLIPFATAYSADVLYGDVNGDGVVNGQDVTAIMQKVAGWSVPNFNDVAADFHPASKALLRLPIKGFIYDADSTIYYRKVYEKEYPTSGILDNDPLMEYDSDASFSFLTADKKLDLPETRESLIVYEFTVTVALDGQIPGTTSHDYFDATLSIDLFFNAVSKE